ncbi:hypothetical protein HDV05_007258 [Chytridiales sp. JEL 0842]|nr:hypothetical protein HDV05_007258 [Chytridiales sp. JEL 0842]
MGNSLGRLDQLDFNAEIELRHFTLLRCVGKGAFGKVRIVEKRDTRKLYALKYINKLQMIRQRATQNIFRERSILESLDHPLIVNLRYAFQDDENVFMVLDLMMGGDLRFHLERNGGFSEGEVRLWAAELVCGISYLHSMGVVHRDLKPDNILLDAQGHAHLTDFNIAVRYQPSKPLKSHSGTLAYMAPEIFQQKGYTPTVDFWSLGVVLYELLHGKRPFRGSTSSSLKNSILKAPLSFPTTNPLTKSQLQLSHPCLRFLSGLLQKDPASRLGNSGFNELFMDPWFQGLDWISVENKRGVWRGFVPEADRPNFDATYDLEELLLEENPLSYKPRKRKSTKETNKEKGGAGGGGGSPTPQVASEGEVVECEGGWGGGVAYAAGGGGACGEEGVFGVREEEGGDDWRGRDEEEWRESGEFEG